MTTVIYFIRHAEPDFTVHEDMVRPLTKDGLNAALELVDFMKDKDINVVISSPFKRAVDTVKPMADDKKISIEIIDDFRERKIGNSWIDDFKEFSTNQWNDFNYKLTDGESLCEVQERNINALSQVLKKYEGKNIVIGTHGTALSTIINYYNPEYGYKDFDRIRGIFPLIVKFIFKQSKCISIEQLSSDE